MDVFFCTINNDDPAYDCLRQRVEDVVPSGDFRIGHSIRDLVEEFKHPSDRFRIVILVAKSNQELDEYLLIRDLFNDVSIILILPDFEKDTLRKASILYPRFTFHLEIDFEIVASVLVKMLKHLHSKYIMLKGMKV